VLVAMLMCAVENEPPDTPKGDDEIARLLRGDDQVVGELFVQYRERLERMLDYRLDRRLYGRVDPSDVLQETYIEVARRIHEYRAAPSVSFFVWLRQITFQTLLTIHRRHLGQKRNAGQDVSLHTNDHRAAAPFSLADQLLTSLTSPSQVAIRNEHYWQLRDAIDRMDPTDREVLSLRHFEQLDNSEVAQTLGLSKTAASNRYVRALKRLRGVVAATPPEEARQPLGSFR
jgi:RNA polymerase sigma-70 factor (ECF subfamily)